MDSVVDANERTPESLYTPAHRASVWRLRRLFRRIWQPLVSWVAKEVIRYGGGANLAETDELIGAEPYVLQNVRDTDTAQHFLDMIARFKDRVAWHGESAEGNPSGGNKFRGLYNIVLKSIGAAMKRHPDTQLDYCIEYGEPMREPGYYFMDSPGNDLESIAGQVASGCNAIFFVTGNGSITNFPFVPTLKVVTTTQRYEMLERDMDINAGAYQDGISMDALVGLYLDLTVAVAGGQRSKGENAGHAQVQIWRNWPQKDGDALEALRNAPAPNGYGMRPDVDEAPTIRRNRGPAQWHHVDKRSRGTHSANQFVFRANRSHDCRTPQRTRPGQRSRHFPLCCPRAYRGLRRGRNNRRRNVFSLYGQLPTPPHGGSSPTLGTRL